MRGYHVYSKYWPDPKIGEELSTKREPYNKYDKYAVAVMRSRKIVGHVPREIAKYCSTFIKENGTIKCKVDGEPQQQKSTMTEGKDNKEVPCVYKFSSQDESLLTRVTNALTAQHVPQCDNSDW